MQRNYLAEKSTLWARGAFIAGIVTLAMLLSQQSYALDVTVESMAASMRLPHQQVPAGVPGNYDWAQRPVIQRITPPKGYTAITGWGQVYQTSALLRAPQKVELRSFKTYIITKNSEVKLVQSTNDLTGGVFEPTYANNTNTSASIARAPSQGTIAQLVPQHPFQFWPKEGRVKIQPEDVAGVIVVVEARLSSTNQQPLHPSPSQFVLSVGADYWKDLTAPWDHYKTNQGIGVGRFSYLTEDWQCFTMSTLKTDLSTLANKVLAC